MEIRHLGRIIDRIKTEVIIMRDKNIIIALLASGIIALAACSANNGSGNQAGQENGSESSVIVDDTAQMPNPWTDTTELDEAEKATGISFEPLSAEAVPEGLELATYRYTDNILEVVYRGGDNELTVRASTETDGESLTGDYNVYSKEWDEEIDGSIVHCKGDGKHTNCAYADVRSIHLAVMYNPGEEGKGLDTDGLKALFMGIKAAPME